MAPRRSPAHPRRDLPASTSLTITAANGVGTAASQNFTLSVSATTQAPAITSASSTTFAAGTAGTFTVTATGLPSPTLTETGHCRLA